MPEYEQPEYTIWSRRSDGNPAGPYRRIMQVQDYQSLTLDLRWGEASTWSMLLPYDEFVKRWNITPYPTSSLISDGYGYHGIMIFRNGGSFPTASRNGDLILSGPMLYAIRDWVKGKDVMIIGGENDTFRCARE